MVCSVHQRGNRQHLARLQLQRVQEAVLGCNGTPLRRIVVDCGGNLRNGFTCLHQVGMRVVCGLLVDLGDLFGKGLVLLQGDG